MQDFLIGSGICAALILTCVAVFYELMARAWVLLPRLGGQRRQILFTISLLFIGHTIAVWLFGITDYVLDVRFHFGSLVGGPNGFWDHLYFSGVTYSSLGFGNIDATGGLRLLAVVESVLGLILIGWTVTFTYLVTHEYLLQRRKA